MTQLHNRVNKVELKHKLSEETFKRLTISFYRYVMIDNPEAFRDEIYLKLKEINCFGRIYVAHEGINAQMSVPEENYNHFLSYLNDHAFLKNVPVKIAVEDDGKSFYKLNVKVRVKIVADGLNDETIDVTNVGTHLSAVQFNEAMSDPETIVVDMRNHYESEIGHFENAICPQSDTFKEELPMALNMLKGKEDKKLLLYCTGGIRCEKASAYFKHYGFTDVNQLHGGIIDYARQVKKQGLKNKFRGKNFVFDERLGERIGEEIISKCHQCGNLSDIHVNCANNECHLLFIQCPSCTEKMQGCCTDRCVEIISLPIEAQKELRKGKIKVGKEAHAVYKSRLRPNLAQYMKNQSENK